MIIKTIISGITKQLYETLCKSVSSETCTASNQDIAFIIDGSSSIHRKDYEKVKKWITTIVEGLEIGQGKIQILSHFCRSSAAVQCFAAKYRVLNR